MRVCGRRGEKRGWTQGREGQLRTRAALAVLRLSGLHQGGLEGCWQGRGIRGSCGQSRAGAWETPVEGLLGCCTGAGWGQDRAEAEWPPSERPSCSGTVLRGPTGFGDALGGKTRQTSSEDCAILAPSNWKTGCPTKGAENAGKAAAVETGEWLDQQQAGGRLRISG